MLSALLVLMTGFVGGVAVTVALGVGLYFMVMGNEGETDVDDWTPPAPTKAPTSPPAPAAAPPLAPTSGHYGELAQRPAVSPPWPRSSSVDRDDWRY